MAADKRKDVAPNLSRRELTPTSVDWLVRRVVELAAVWDGTSPEKGDKPYTTSSQIRTAIDALSGLEAEAADAEWKQYEGMRNADLAGELELTFKKIASGELSRDEAVEEIREALRYIFAMENEEQSEEDIGKLAVMMYRDTETIKVEGRGAPDAAREAVSDLTHALAPEWTAVSPKTIYNWAPFRTPGPRPRVQPPQIPTDDAIKIIHRAFDERE